MPELRQRSTEYPTHSSKAKTGFSFEGRGCRKEFLSCENNPREAAIKIWLSRQVPQMGIWAGREAPEGRQPVEGCSTRLKKMKWQSPRSVRQRHFQAKERIETVNPISQSSHSVNASWEMDDAMRKNNSIVGHCLIILTQIILGQTFRLRGIFFSIIWRRLPTLQFGHWLQLYFSGWCIASRSKKKSKSMISCSCSLADSWDLFSRSIWLRRVFNTRRLFISLWFSHCRPLLFWFSRRSALAKR